LFRELATAFGQETYVVAVDDGSVRQPLDVSSIEAGRLEGAVLRLKRNVGHQRAIAVGLSHVADNLADARRIVVMDSAGEDLLQSIPALLRGLESVETDVVAAQRRNRVETPAVPDVLSGLQSDIPVSSRMPSSACR